MKVEVLPAAPDDETAFRNIYQFYMYEFSRFMRWSPNYGGRFREDDLDGCWTDPHRHPFWVKVDGQLAGLAIVDTGTRGPQLCDENVIYMAEFFIMGAWQTQGIGEHVATHLFGLFPGKWEVFELAENTNAQAFWRKVIGRYAGDDYREIPVGENGEHGVMQCFDNSIGE